MFSVPSSLLLLALHLIQKLNAGVSLMCQRVASTTGLVRAITTSVGGEGPGGVACLRVLFAEYSVSKAPEGVSA